MHDTCQACETTQSASDILVKRGARMTGLRRDVLSALHHENRAIGAYDLFDQLKQDGKVSAPAAVYRVLDFLVTSGLAHKVEALSAYAACAAGGGAHSAILLVCEGCGNVDEKPGKLAEPLGGFDREKGFQTHAISVEALGLCATCQAEMND
jgi:Fur family zinc uptake transcriptional regulator